MQRCLVIEGVCATPGAEGVPTFGVEVALPTGEVWRWEDVDVDPAVAACLADRLQRAQPEACHFRDMVLDFIEEMAGKV